MAIIKNIIFDLGGVIINIDYNLTSAAFKILGISNFDELYSQFKQNNLFDLLETGQIVDDDFIQSIAKLLSPKIKSEQIVDAWNAMLLDIPKVNIDLLKSLKNKYNLYLLSNTNNIHYKAYHKTLSQVHGFNTMNQLMNKAYYSHEIKMRKPDIETYLYVITNAGINAEETIFIEDTIVHIEGAKKAGLHTWHLQNQNLMASWAQIENYIHSIK